MLKEELTPFAMDVGDEEKEKLSFLPWRNKDI
jgi:hypothetical protein